ncbi:MAG: glyoxalase [Phycisphaeraceae bacterium]|jgi:catechol 2,3-dioxygenase-like lactoylglutathione lyase family enzyme|nr:glyoxalase [Phycisphaeraceae bacterium]
MTVEFTHQTPVLPVADLHETQRYYRDVLHFNVDWTDRDQFGAVSNGAISVFFSRSPGSRSQCVLVWNTANADDVLADYRASGARIVQDIANRPWGMREFVIEDLNGHRMRIGHVDESAADYGRFTSA